MKQRGRALTLPKCPVGEKTHRRQKKGRNPSLTGVPDEKTAKRCHSAGRAVVAPGFQAERDCGQPKRSPHLHKVEAIPHTPHSPPPPPRPPAPSHKGTRWRKDFRLTRAALGGAGSPLCIRVEGNDVHGIGCVRNQPLQVHRAGISRHHDLEGRTHQILLDHSPSAYRVFY